MPLKVLRADKEDTSTGKTNIPAKLPQLHQGQDLEQLVHSPEAAGKKYVCPPVRLRRPHPTVHQRHLQLKGLRRLSAC